MSRPKNPSKYAKYNTQIKRWLLQGLTHQKIVDKLNELEGEYDKFTESGLNYYCKKKGLISYRSRCYHSSKFEVITCDTCEHCRFITSTNGKREVRMCKEANRMITQGAKAVTWCPISKQLFK